MDVPSTAAMAAHIDRICARAKVTVNTATARGRAWRKSSRIAIRPVKSDITYAVALHELGHVLGVQSGKRLDKEVQAWQWARAHALVWTEAMTQKETACLASYVRWANRKPNSSPKHAETVVYLNEVGVS